MNLISEKILSDYKKRLPTLEKQSAVILSIINEVLKKNNLYVTVTESRVKSEDSLIGKLELKGEKYRSINDITDLVGARIVTYYNNQVDKIASIFESIFEVNHDNSVDKRKIASLNSFGYLSLHYICKIPKSVYFDPETPEINEYSFELQMRSALQHVWATIYHNIGYKSDIEIPKNYLRRLSRLSGLLELADNEFDDIRLDLEIYRKRIMALTASGNFDEVALDADGFDNYLTTKPFEELLNRIAAINIAEVKVVSCRPYLETLLNLGFKTIGDLERLKKDYSDHAYKIVLAQIGNKDVDIIVSSVALKNLCIAYIIRNADNPEKSLKNFHDSLYGVKDKHIKTAKSLLKYADVAGIIPADRMKTDHGIAEEANEVDVGLVDKAIKFAVEAHAGQKRKGKDFPYVIHPLEALAIAATMTEEKELLAAAVLHDVVEDCDYTIDDIRKKFGNRVASLVDFESEDRNENVSKEASWLERKKIALDKLRNYPYDAKLVALCDKLSNARAIYRDYLAMGDKVWLKFHNTDPKLHEWRYRGLLEALHDLHETNAYQEFSILVNRIFNSQKA